MAKEPSKSLPFDVLRREILSGSLRSLYLLSGEESYLPEELCRMIMENAMDPADRDFNQTVLFGSETNADTIVSFCQEFPMFSQTNRRLIVVKDAQSLKKTDALERYVSDMTETTVLVLLYSGKAMDKRTSFYKKAVSAGAFFESPKMELEQMPGWIEEYVATQGMKIEPDAALLMADSAGTSLRKIVMEVDKMQKNLPSGTQLITVSDVERNVGVSREFSTMELTAALARKDASKAFRIAYFFGASPKQYPVQMTFGWLFYFFSKVELIHAYALEQHSSRPNLKDAAAGAGIFYRYAGPYLAAAANYPLMKTMQVVSLLREYDYKSKSNERGDASDGELLLELVTKILN